jgi:hypothetical protein
MGNVKKAICSGDLKIGNFSISCAVLDDETNTRVLVSRSVANVLGRKGAGAYWKRKKEAEKGMLIPEYISAKYLQPFISPELKLKLETPITYVNKSGVETEGLEATILPEICDVWIKAKESGTLSPSQGKIAQKAYILLKGFAHVGITALVDEATGYQEIRDRKALEKILQLYIAKELLPWAKRFPDEFYKELFRLRGWTWKGMSINRPSYVGKLTNDLVYARIAVGLLEELKRLTPKDEKGQRKNRFHQWLTPDIGHPELAKHLAAVIALMKASSTWDGFKRAVERALPKRGGQLEWPIEDLK